MPGPTFFTRRSDRLIARLKHLLYAWRFARQVDGRVIMLWPDELAEPGNQSEGAKYSASLIIDLQTFYAQGGAGSLVFMGERKGAPPRRWVGPSLYDPAYKAMRFNRFPREMFADDGMVFYEPRLMRFQLEDEQKSSVEILRELDLLFRQLPPTPAVQRRLEQIRERLAASYYAVLHVSGHDNFEQLRRELRGYFDGINTRERVDSLLNDYLIRTAPFELYEPAVRRAIEEKKRIAYLSDSPGSIDWFRKKFGAAHFVDISSIKMRIPIQKAFLDFLVLKGASRIVGARIDEASFAAELGCAEHVMVSAADVAELSSDEVAALYFETALHEFLPDKAASSPQARELREIIAETQRSMRGTVSESTFMPSPQAPKVPAIARLRSRLTTLLGG